MIISTRDIPDTIRKLRQQANLSQQELADASGVNMHTISRIERRLTSPTVRILEKIIEALGQNETLALSLKYPQ